MAKINRHSVWRWLRFQGKNRPRLTSFVHGIVFLFLSIVFSAIFDFDAEALFPIL